MLLQTIPISTSQRYYFGSTGKAYSKSYGKTINGKKYGFDEDGKMLFGYVEDASYNIINDDDDPILNATYYYGTNEDGARHTGWLQYTDAFTDEDYDEDYYWFYFNTSNGKKVTGTQKTINGKKYSFDTNGVMNFEWAKSSYDSAKKMTNTAWYGRLADGSLAKNQWIWNKPYEDAELPSTIDDYNDETERWFRTDASGNLVKGQTKKINSKWYVFDTDGVMRTGLVVLNNNKGDANGAVSGTHGVDFLDMDTVTVKDIEDSSYRKNLHYFSEDEEKDGSMKSGTMSIELADDTKTFCFDKNTGAAKDGYDSSSKKVYKSGILQKAGDDKYKVKTYTNADGKKVSYLVGTTGNVVKAVNKYKDANDQYYIYLKDYEYNGTKYQWIIAATYDEDVAKKAVKDKSIADCGDPVGFGPEA